MLPRVDGTTQKRARREISPPGVLRRLVLVYVESRRLPMGRAWTLGEAPLALVREVAAEADGAEGAPGLAYIPSAVVSRRPHATLALEPKLGVMQLRDGGHENGTRVDGRTLASGEVVPLAPGSVIAVGDALLVYTEFRASVPLAVAVPWDVSPARAQAEQLVRLAATSELPVLVLGPTGAGKELLARAFHDASVELAGRARDRFVAINCAGIPPGLAAAELFGHKRGAFTGADEKAGLLETGHGGTVFLDEVAELPVEQQSSLLRALQQRTVRRLGSNRDIDIDVRVVSATSRDVDALEQEGQLRPDFLGRIGGVRVELPGLAQRREEIVPLFRLFLERALARTAKDKPPPPPHLTFDAAEKLLLYDWPKNVRELEHAARAAAMFAAVVPAIDTPLLPAAVQRAGAAAAEADEGVRVSREVLIDLLRVHGGNVTRVATALGQSKQKVYRWLAAYKLSADAYRGR